MMREHMAIYKQKETDARNRKTRIWMNMWVWVNTYRYIFSGMNIHLPAILGFTRYQGFDPSPCEYHNSQKDAEQYFREGSSMMFPIQGAWNYQVVVMIMFWGCTMGIIDIVI